LQLPDKIPTKKPKSMTIEWNEKFSVNNTAIDAEHKSLFDALNSFYQGVQSGASNESLAALLTKLADYAATHFRSEEIFMKKIGFFLESYNSGKAPASFEVTHFIMDWIVNHIKREDMKYAKFSQGH
jgi:hemerythrin